MACSIYVAYNKVYLEIIVIIEQSLSVIGGVNSVEEAGKPGPGPVGEQKSEKYDE